MVVRPGPTTQIVGPLARAYRNAENGPRASMSVGVSDASERSFAQAESAACSCPAAGCVGSGVQPANALGGPLPVVPTMSTDTAAAIAATPAVAQRAKARRGLTPFGTRVRQLLAE